MKGKHEPEIIETESQQGRLLRKAISVQRPKTNAISGKKRCPLRRLVGDRAFTLIELLVVIAVIGVLISIMAPSLSKARMMARQTRELNAARQLMVAFTCYAGDNKGAVLQGYPTADSVSGSMVVLDDRGKRVIGPEAQRYPWRIVPYLGNNFSAMYNDPKVLASLKEREAAYSTIGESWGYVGSLFPSFGMNIAFVGGSDKHSANDKKVISRFGRFYVSKIDEVSRPSRLISFISARVNPGDLDAASGASAAVTMLGSDHFDGYFMIEPPSFITRNWESVYDERAASARKNSGYVSCRYSRKAMATSLDGHAEMLSWNELDDMTRWSNVANEATWYLGKK